MLASLRRALPVARALLVASPAPALSFAALRLALPAGQVRAYSDDNYNDRENRPAYGGGGDRSYGREERAPRVYEPREPNAPFETL